MKIHIVLALFFVFAVFFTEAAPGFDWEDFGKELEGVGQRVFKVAKDVLPVAQGYLQVYQGFSGDDKKDD